MDEKRNYVQVKGPSGRWKGEAIGDELEGILISKEATTFRGRPNYKYWIETSHPEAVDGVVMVYGTGALNSAFEKIPEGYFVCIVYQGERPSADPKHKPYQLYDVFVDVQEDDPLYEKLMSNDNGKTRAPTQDNAMMDDPQAREYIKEITEEIGTANPEEIVKHAVKNKEKWELTSDEITRIKAQLARDMKQKQKEGGE